MKVAVLGAGAMGTGIGQVAAQNSCQVVYYDSFPGAIDRSKSSIEKIFSRLVEKGRQTKSQFSLNEDEIENIFDLIEEEHPDL